MARQPLIAVVVVAALAGCREDLAWEGTFDVPHAIAVLQPEVGGPFDEPIGYVASLSGGQIAMLATKQGRYLTDDGAASFVRAAPLATGHARVLGALAVRATPEGAVDVFAADRAYGQLLRVPHVTGMSRGEPVRHPVTHTEPVFTAGDGSTTRPRLTDLRVRLGWTSTEHWTIESDGARWWATGSRSGRQATPIEPGEPWGADHRTIELTITGRSTAGDKFDFDTDSGIVEVDLGGVPGDLALAPDQSVLALTVQDRASADRALWWVDPSTDALLGTVALPTGAKPGRMTWADGALWVADGGGNGVLEVRRDGNGDTVVAHPTPWPVLDVAPLFTTERLLYLVPESGDGVYLYDLATDAIRDANPLVDGDTGISFEALVRGVEAIPMAFEYPETDGDGVHLRGAAVAISLLDGRVEFAEDGTGCLLRDEIGPRTTLVSQFSDPPDYTTNFGVSGGAFLEQNGEDTRSVQVSPCGGVALGETWTLTYDRTVQAWRVDGAVSGEQTRLAYEDVRYTSDTGAISFTVRGGLNPSEDGWQIAFAVTPGVLAANGDNDDDAEIEVPFELPGDPVFFHYRVGGSGGGWDLVDERPLLLVAAENSDVVTRIEPQTGETQVAWW